MVIHAGIQQCFPNVSPRTTFSWSNAGDLVLDLFMGSGTTGKMAIKNNRRFIGIEISPECVEIAKRRLDLVAPKESVSDFSLAPGVPVTEVCQPA